MLRIAVMIQTTAVWPVNGTIPNSPNTTASTATCQMKMPYDHRPSASIAGEVRNGNGRSETLASTPARPSEQISGASSVKPQIAPSAIFTANCHGARTPSPVGPAIGVHASPYATTNTTSMSLRRAPTAATTRVKRVGWPSSSAPATSASTRPATNHGRCPSTQLVGSTPSGVGSSSAIHPQLRLTAPSASSTGIRADTLRPRSANNAKPRIGSRR